MKLLAISYFDPASVVLSHRNLMRAAGHDFRLAVVRAYTEKQREADWVCEQLTIEKIALSPLKHNRRAYWEKLGPDRNELREFAASADVIQFHPGIGHGDGDWASREGQYVDPDLELSQVLMAFDLNDLFSSWTKQKAVHFIHGSRATWSNLAEYKKSRLDRGRIATSTIDYARELDAAYLPPLVDVGTREIFTAIDPNGSTLGTFGTKIEAQKAFPGKGIVATPIPLRAKLRGDDDPLLVAHTPTDRVACSTEEFLKAAQGLGIPVRLGEGLKHADVLRLKAACNAGFDHLRGAFSVNTLENAALGLVPLFALKPEYRERLFAEGIEPFPSAVPFAGPPNGPHLSRCLRLLSENPAQTGRFQQMARSWWETYFSAEPITRRLTKFYESL